LNLADFRTGCADGGVQTNAGKGKAGMSRENIHYGAGFSTLPGFEGLKRRSIDSYERALAEHIATETRLRADLARNAALLRNMEQLVDRRAVMDAEGDHRLINNLSMIVSLLSLQSRSEPNAEIASRLSIAASRVAAIGRVHRHLKSMDGRQTVSFRTYLDDLCRIYSEMLASEVRADQVIAVEGTEVDLPTIVAIPLSLIANELITNAIKHGLGRIVVRLEGQITEGYALSVANDGSVLPDDFAATARKGLGMSLVLGLVAQIGGELRIDRGDTGEGTRFTVLFS
jgi:two-component sensor histidine kinase